MLTPDSEIPEQLGRVPSSIQTGPCMYVEVRGFRSGRVAAPLWPLRAASHRPSARGGFVSALLCRGPPHPFFL